MIQRGRLAPIGKPRSLTREYRAVVIGPHTQMVSIRTPKELNLHISSELKQGKGTREAKGNWNQKLNTFALMSEFL
jgi:hypothetical protein